MAYMNVIEPNLISKHINVTVIHSDYCNFSKSRQKSIQNIKRKWSFLRSLVESNINLSQAIGKVRREK